MKRSEEFADIIKTIYETGNIIGKVKKDGTNPHYKSRYATLNSLLDAIEGPMEASKLFLTQVPEGENKLTTLVYHSPSNQWIEFTSEAPLAAQNAQGVGSLISYLRRYSIMSLFHLGTEDDDGNAASKVPQPVLQPPQQQRISVAQPLPQTQNYSQQAPPPPPQKKVFTLEWLKLPEFVEQIKREQNRYSAENKQFSLGNYLAQRYQITQEQLNETNNWWYGK